MHIADLNARIFQVGGEILRHFFGKRGDQHPLPAFGTLMDLSDEIVDLPLYRTDLNDRVQQTGWPDDLLHHLAGAGTLILGGGG